ncbi:MAG: DUF6580 family putative transport protein [Candidatus Saccharimonadales bacterium]
MRSKLNKKTQKNVAVIIVISAVIMRLVPHIPNFAPITAGALFGASHLSKKYALLLPILMMAVSDYALLYISPFSHPIFNFSHIQPISAMFNSTTLWVWGSFMVSGALGLFLRNKPGILKVGSITLLASLQFYLITNFGVWAAGAYARNFSGLAASYVAGLPFLKWTIAGDLFYTAFFFMIYALATRQSESAEATQLESQTAGL